MGQDLQFQIHGADKKSMKIKVASFFLAMPMLVGCNSQVAEFVEAAKRARSETTTTTTMPMQTADAMRFKVSPGKINTATTNTGAISAVITPTNQKFTMGTDMSMTMTINRTRTSPQ